MTLETNAVAAPTTKPITRYFPAVVRVLLGLLFLVAGLNGFLNFLPQPSDPIPEGAAALGLAFVKAGYMFPLIKGTEVIVAVMLLSNRFVPLALAILAPVAINILAFHAFLAPSGVAIPVVVLAMEIYLAWSYRKAYRPMLAMRATPGAD
ncbi:MAG: DoxX family protein [Minicystis sp.]